MRPFLDEVYSGFCYEMTGILLKFDLIIGKDYNFACESKQISEDVIQLTGNATSHLKIIEQLDHCDGLKYEIDMPRDKIVPDLIDDYMLRFLTDKGPSMIIDRSNFKICYKRLR